MTKLIDRIVRAIDPHAKLSFREKKLCNFCNEDLAQKPFTKYAIVRGMHFEDMNICTNCWPKEEAIEYIRTAIRIYYPRGRYSGGKDK